MNNCTVNNPDRDLRVSNSGITALRDRSQVTMPQLQIKFLLLFAVMVMAMVLSQPATAQQRAVDEPVFGVFYLTVSEGMEVKNDLMSVRLTAQAQGSDSSELANKINAIMTWASARLREFKSLTVQTQSYQTYPRYEKNGSKITGWTASQSIQIESDDFEQAGKAIQTLQERLLVQGMSLKPKPETRKSAESVLINKALDAFKQRALLIQQNMGAPGYRMMNVAINTGGQIHRANDFQARARSSMAVESAPSIEAGTSRVEVSIDGRIQLD